MIAQSHGWKVKRRLVLCIFMQTRTLALASLCGRTSVDLGMDIFFSSHFINSSFLSTSTNIQPSPRVCYIKSAVFPLYHFSPSLFEVLFKYIYNLIKEAFPLISHLYHYHHACQLVPARQGLELVSLRYCLLYLMLLLAETVLSMETPVTILYYS